MKKILFEDATLTSQAKVTIDGVDHLVTEAEYNGGTDLNANTFNELQDNVEDAIEDATNLVKWTLLGSATGTNNIKLPNDFNELYITVEGNGGYYWGICLVPKLILSETKKEINLGGRFTSTGFGVGVAGEINLTTYNTKYAYSNGTDKVADTTTTIYYR